MSVVSIKKGQSAANMARIKRIMDALDRVDRMIKEHNAAAESYRIKHIEKRTRFENKNK